jgi:hypothetical protein
MARIATIHTFVFLVLVAGDLNAQSDASPYPMFREETPLELRISAPFRALGGDDADERPEYDAVLEHVQADSDVVALDIEIRIRGRSRLDNCDYPPLSLQFPGDAIAGTVFEGQNRLKLVTLCKRSDIYRDYLTQEFQIYRMFNELTDRSFRVRWASVEYVYTDTRRPRSRIEPAFLIEEDWEVAERLGMEIFEPETIEREALDAQHTVLMALFQFLVGNTDWAVTEGPPGELCCHNGKVIGDSDGPLIVLPYDFDNAGLINAEYAFPNEILPIRSVTQRLYRGFCAMNEQLDAAIAQIDQRRQRLIELLDDERVSARSRRRALDYLNESFEVIDDPEERQEQIYEKCRP